LPIGAAPGGITLGPDGNLIWFTEQGLSQIGMINPADPNHTVQNFGFADGMTQNSLPTGIAADDGALWFTQIGSDQIGRLDPATGQITEYSAPAAMVAHSAVQQIIAGPDGDLWFSEFGAIAAFNPAAQVPNTPLVIKETVPLPGGSNEQVFSLSPGPNNTNTIWYTEGVLNSTLSGYVSFGVGKIDTNTVNPTPTEIPLSYQPYGIAAGQDGDIWITTIKKPNASTIDMISPSSGIVTPIPIPTNVVPIPDASGITLGPDGNLWFGDGGGNGAIGVVDDTQLALSVPNPQPSPVNVNSPFGIGVSVVYDSGVVDAAFNDSVTITLHGGTPGASLLNSSGSPVSSITVTAVDGVASFSGPNAIIVNQAGSGYTLEATSSATNGPTSGTSGSFNVVSSQPPPTPTISGEQVAYNPRKLNKKGKPIGKLTVAGYTIDFSTSMNQASLAIHANYQVDMFVVKKVRKKPKMTVPVPIGFSVSKVTSNSVTLSVGNQKFLKGGQIMVFAGGAESAAGAFLAATGVLPISPGGKAIR